MSDPYNRNGPMAEMLQQKVLLDAMEKAWKACVKSPIPASSLIVLSERIYFDVMHAWHTCDLPWYRGHEFLPYG